MIQINFQEYTRSYYILRTLENHEDYTINLGRSNLTRKDVHIYKLGGLTESDIKETMDTYFKNYSAELCVNTLCFVINKT